MKTKKTKILTAVIMSLVCVAIKKKKTIKKRRWWKRPWLIQEKGHATLIHNEFLQHDPEQFRTCLRMDNALFEDLLQKVSPIISKTDTFMRESITPRDQLTITLRFLATGEPFRSLWYAFRIHESTISLFVPKVCEAICKVLRDEYLKVPSSAAEWLNISKEFENHWNCPNTIGALDGKHIVFRAPREKVAEYRNYKGTHSIVLLALVDANYLFTYVDIGCNGRVSDGGVFLNSSLYKKLYAPGNQLNLPEERSLPGRNNPMPYVIVADSAFALSTHLIKPFPFKNITPQQRIFNYRLSRARRVVENAFGMLANRFRILLGTINLNQNKAQLITMTCCILHNYLRINGSQFFFAEQGVDKEYTFKYALSQQGGNHSAAFARTIRDEFLEYFNNEGAVPWQNNLDLLF